MQLKVLKDWGRYKEGDIADIADKAVIAKCTAVGVLGPIDGEQPAKEEEADEFPNDDNALEEGQEQQEEQQGEEAPADVVADNQTIISNPPEKEDKKAKKK